MMESVENLILEHSRAIRSKQDDHSERLDRIEIRLSSLEQTLGSLYSLAGSDQDTIRSLTRRIKHIERRVDPRVVVQHALANNAAAVILAHNHPSGYANPSQSDSQITRRLKQALELIDVRVLDHFVVGGEEVYSFAEHGLL